MGVMVQIRDVPLEVQEKLRLRAASAGMSLSEFLLREVRGASQGVPFAEMRARLKKRSKTYPTVSAAEIIRAERDRT